CSPDGVHLEFTQTSLLTYSATLSYLGKPGSVTISGMLSRDSYPNPGPVYSTMDLLTVQVTTPGPKGSNSFYFNNLIIVPEPAGPLLALFALAASSRRWGR